MIKAPKVPACWKDATAEEVIGALAVTPPTAAAPVGSVEAAVEMTVEKPELEAGRLVDNGAIVEDNDDDITAVDEDEGTATTLESRVMVIAASVVDETAELVNGVVIVS